MRFIHANFRVDLAFSIRYWESSWYFWLIGPTGRDERVLCIAYKSRLPGDLTSFPTQLFLRVLQNPTRIPPWCLLFPKLQNGFRMGVSAGVGPAPSFRKHEGVVDVGFSLTCSNSYRTH
jgi:hypothetical protein